MPDQVVSGGGSDSSPNPHRVVPGDRGWGDGPPVPRPIDPFRDGPLPSDKGNPAPPGYVNRTASERVQGAVTGPDAIPMVYGKQMVEGRVISVTYDAYNRYRDFVIGVAAGEVYSVTLVDIPFGVSQSDPAWGVYLGALSQTPYPTLAYVTARQYLMYWDGTNWIPYETPTEAPSAWRFIVEGRLITDTRTGVTAYSTNPAMCLRHFLLSVTYGAGMDASVLDEQSFKDAADICDQVVDSKKRYELNIALLSEASCQEWADTICTHFAAQLYVQDGKYRLWVDGTTSDSGIAFDTSNSREWTLTETPVSERPSRVVVEYPREENLWATDKATAELAGASTTGQTREAVYKLEGVTDALRAQRLAEYLLKVQAIAPLRVTLTASPLAARLARGTRFKLTFPNGVSGQDFLVTDLQPQENGEFVVEAREYDSAVYTPGVPVSGPPAPIPGPDPSGTPPDVTVSAWGTHWVIDTDSPSEFSRHGYAMLEYTLPANYIFGAALVIRGKLTTSDLAWDSLGDEVVVPLAGNLSPSGGKFRLYWPFTVKTETKQYHPSMEIAADIVSWLAFKVMVKLRSTVGTLSAGVSTRLPAPISSTSNHSDGGSALQATQLLRLMEAPANGTSHWDVTAAASLGSNRTLTLPDTDPVAGPVDIDGSGNLSFPGTGVRSTEEMRLLEAPANGSNYWSLKSAASLGSNRTLTLPDAAPPSSGVVVVDSSGNIAFREDSLFHSHKNGTDQTGVSDSTWTKVTFGTEDFDIGSDYDAGNSKYVAPEAGKFRFTAAVVMTPAASETLIRVSLYKNGSEVKTMANQGSLSTRGLTATVTATLSLAANDEIEVYVYHTVGSSGTVFGGSALSYFEGQRVG